jgi:hypothetical protein
LYIVHAVVIGAVTDGTAGRNRAITTDLKGCGSSSRDNKV